MNYKLKFLIGTDKYETHQGNVVNGLYNESSTIPNGSYQMPPPIHYNHCQQNNHLQQSTIPHSQVHHNHKSIQLQQSTVTQGQHYNHHQQNVHLQQSVMHQPMTYVAQHNTPRKHNPAIGSTTYTSKPLVALPKHKIPANSPILWELSLEVREWKFLGRYLDLEEEIIDEIDYNTRPNKTRDKALKVLTEWVNSSSPTWEMLGKALLEAEYVLLYERLLEIFDKYVVG